MTFTRLIALATAGLAFATGSAYAAPSNQPPPAGAILDLAGQPITNTGQLYSVNFTAGVSATAITFAFRQDPAFETFYNASLVDLTTSSANLLTNGNFSGGVYTSSGNTATPVGWTYANMYGATYGGVEGTTAQCANGGYCWYDGAVQAYDAISQTVTTHVGDVYKISFNLDGGTVGTTYSRFSTNGNVTNTGGNGIDVLAYAQSGLPAMGTAVPEPATWALMLVGFGTVGFAMRRRSTAKLSAPYAKA